MRQLIRDPMVPNFAARPKEREFTGILGVDMRPVMLLEAQAGYERLMKRHGDILRENLKLRFLEADFLQLDSKMLAGMEFDALDTILASYFIHWASDKEAAVKKFSELLIPGGKLITVEEWPLVVTPSSHMTAEQAERIKRNALPIDPNRYYKMLREHGFREVQGGVLDMEIDVHHRMFGHVFVKE
jgi:SAM-dependent methyltransferase